jgi:hypothetical protein
VLTVELGETVLQWRAGEDGLARGVDQAAEGDEPLAFSRSSADLLKGRHPQELQSVGLLERPAQSILIQDFRQVEEGASHGGDRDPRFHCPFVAGQL